MKITDIIDKFLKESSLTAFKRKKLGFLIRRGKKISKNNSIPNKTKKI